MDIKWNRCTRTPCTHSGFYLAVLNVSRTCPTMKLYNFYLFMCMEIIILIFVSNLSGLIYLSKNKPNFPKRSEFRPAFTHLF